LHFHCKRPVIIKRNYQDISVEEFQLYSATDIELLIVDGLGDGIWLEANGIKTEIIEKLLSIFYKQQVQGSTKQNISPVQLAEGTSYNVLETIDRIKRFTSHLKGLKIAVMGCVVNGPGEMADADYGYVGAAGVGKINLYKGKNLAQRNIDEKDALVALIDLIKRK